MSLTRQELHDLAAAGVVAKVQDMERTLAALQKEWPHLFLSTTPPVLLAPTLKGGSNGNGHWPPVLASAAPTPPPFRRPTPPRVVAREQQILALVAQQPTGVTPAMVTQHLRLDKSTTIRTLGRMCRHQQLRRAAHGLYVATDAPASAPSTPTRPQRTRKAWTQAQRAAASKRMKARWKDPKSAKHLAASLKKARRERHAR